MNIDYARTKNNGKEKKNLNKFLESTIFFLHTENAMDNLLYNSNVGVKGQIGQSILKYTKSMSTSYCVGFFILGQLMGHDNEYAVSTGSFKGSKAIACRSNPTFEKSGTFEEKIESTIATSECLIIIIIFLKPKLSNH